jgi:hypothetical protein
MTNTARAELRPEALGLLAALERNPNRLEAMEQADDVIAVYRAVVGPLDADITAAYERVLVPDPVAWVA